VGSRAAATSIRSRCVSARLAVDQAASNSASWSRCSTVSGGKSSTISRASSASCSSVIADLLRDGPHGKGDVLFGSTDAVEKMPILTRAGPAADRVVDLRPRDAALTVVPFPRRPEARLRLAGPQQAILLGPGRQLVAELGLRARETLLDGAHRDSQTLRDLPDPVPLELGFQSLPTGR